MGIVIRRHTECTIEDFTSPRVCSVYIQCTYVPMQKIVRINLRKLWHHFDYYWNQRQTSNRSIPFRPSSSNRRDDNHKLTDIPQAINPDEINVDFPHMAYTVPSRFDGCWLRKGRLQTRMRLKWMPNGSYRRDHHRRKTRSVLSHRPCTSDVRWNEERNGFPGVLVSTTLMHGMDHPGTTSAGRRCTLDAKYILDSPARLLIKTNKRWVDLNKGELNFTAISFSLRCTKRRAAGFKLIYW